MLAAIAMPAGYAKEIPIIRMPGRDFDLEGCRSTLDEMIQMGGLFPLTRVADRLPFPERTLVRWARSGPFTDCFVLPIVGGSEEGNPIMIHLDFLDGRFQGLAQQARKADDERFRAEVILFAGEAGTPAT